MKNIEIKYNPYFVKTEIRIDGKEPDLDSSLSIKDGTRLQEWVEDLPSSLREETGDCNFNVSFTGITENFEDVKSSFDANEDLRVEFEHIKTTSLVDVENEIERIFDEIKKGPIEELRDKAIVKAFENAKNSTFDVNVVATMSAGKSTLINALLGKRLMPAKNEATTATIVRINDSDVKDKFQASAYDKEDNFVKEFDSITFEDMQELNDDNDVARIEMNGNIPFVRNKTTGMKLTLVDTPGPNNYRTKDHREKTIEMLANSDKSLVLFVMNSTQSGTEDEERWLKWVCENMKEGGKQGRERFIFVLNKLDEKDPDEDADGPNCIVKQLNDVKKNLESKGIINPNIFPVTALPALERRNGSKMQLYFDKFQKMSKVYDCLHLENYYDFTNLPQSIQKEIEKGKEKVSGDDVNLTEIHTGIINIESAIRLYINKYARTIKIKDLVLSFNKKLNELNTLANLEKEISEDKDKKAEFEKQIEYLEERIEKARQKDVFAQRIEAINIMDEVDEEIESIMIETSTQISNLIKLFGQSTKVPKEKAKAECDRLEKNCNDFGLQLKIKLERLVVKVQEETVDSVLLEYENYLKELQLSNTSFSFNALNLVSSNLQSISDLYNNYTETYDETEIQKVTKQRWVPGNRVKRGGWGAFFGGAIGFLLGGPIGAAAGAAVGGSVGAGSGDSGHEEEYETEEEVTKQVDYVDMSKVASNYLPLVQIHIRTIQDYATDYVAKEIERLKTKLKDDLKAIDNLLSEKMQSLKSVKSRNELKAQEIEKKEKDRLFLIKIKNDVDKIIEF